MPASMSGVLYRGTLWMVSLCMIIVGVLNLALFFNALSPAPFDLIVFSSAYRATMQGLNPYDISHLVDLQSQWYPIGYGPCPFLNPPWFLFTMSPFLWADPNLVFYLWRGGSVLAVVCAGWILIRPRSVDDLLPLIALTLCSVPLWYAVYWGQVGAFLALGIVLVYAGIKGDKPIVSGLGFMILAIKPNSVYITVLFLLCELFRTFPLRRVLHVLSIPMVSVFAAAALYPVTTIGWIRSNFGTHSGSSESLFRFRTDTIGSFISLRLGYAESNPTILFLTVGVSICIFFVLIAPRLRTLEGIIVCSLPFSMITGPYGWLHDRAILTLLPAFFWSKLSPKNRVILVGLVGVAQLCAAEILTEQIVFRSVWWYPWSMLAIGAYAYFVADVGAPSSRQSAEAS